MKDISGKSYHEINEIVKLFLPYRRGYEEKMRLNKVCGLKMSFVRTTAMSKSNFVFDI